MLLDFGQVFKKFAPNFQDKVVSRFQKLVSSYFDKISPGSVVPLTMFKTVPLFDFSQETFDGDERACTGLSRSLLWLRSSPQLG